jgi:hypothetical protein
LLSSSPTQPALPRELQHPIKGQKHTKETISPYSLEIGQIAYQHLKQIQIHWLAENKRFKVENSKTTSCMNHQAGLLEHREGTIGLKQVK